MLRCIRAFNTCTRAFQNFTTNNARSGTAIVTQRRSYYDEAPDPRDPRLKTLEIPPLPDGITGDKFELLQWKNSADLFEYHDKLDTVLAVHGPPELWSYKKEPLYGANGGIFAIIATSGHQYKVCADNVLYLNRIDGEVNTQVRFDKVLLLGSIGWSMFGRPYVAQASVLATIEEQTLAGKIHIIKFKKRKGYRRKRGHRQHVTRVRIDEVCYTMPDKTQLVPLECEVDPLEPPVPSSPKLL